MERLTGVLYTNNAGKDIYWHRAPLKPLLNNRFRVHRIKYPIQYDKNDGISSVPLNHWFI